MSIKSDSIFIENYWEDHQFNCNHGIHLISNSFTEDRRWSMMFPLYFYHKSIKLKNLMDEINIFYRLFSIISVLLDNLFSYYFYKATFYRCLKILWLINFVIGKCNYLMILYWKNINQLKYLSELLFILLYGSLSRYLSNFGEFYIFC
jgi:hypothetical protein